MSAVSMMREIDEHFDNIRDALKEMARLHDWVSKRPWAQAPELKERKLVDVVIERLSQSEEAERG